MSVLGGTLNGRPPQAYVCTCCGRSGAARILLMVGEPRGGSESVDGDLHRPETWNSVAAAGYDDGIAPIMRPFALSLLDRVGATGRGPRVRLLDVAAGTGVVAVEAARRGADVLATDFSPGMVQVMRRRFDAEGLAARVEVMDGQALDLQEATFDVATSTFGLIFFPDPDRGLRELCRVVRPGGQVGIASWDITGPSLPRLVGAALARVVPDLPAPSPPPWARLGSLVGLAEALQGAGFIDAAVDVVTHHFELSDPVAFLRRLPEWTPPLRPLFANLPPHMIDDVALAFGHVVDDHMTTDGIPQSALIATASRP